jgi:hypothetical protein
MKDPAELSPVFVVLATTCGTGFSEWIFQDGKAPFFSDGGHGD